MAEKDIHPMQTVAGIKTSDDNVEFAAKPTSSDESSGEELVTVEEGYTDVLTELPKEEGKRILRKVDMRLIPLLTLLYLVAFIDRSNIGTPTLRSPNQPTPSVMRLSSDLHFAQQATPK